MWHGQPSTTYELIREAIDDDPDRVFLVFPDQRLTYREFDERVQLARRALLGFGVSHGDNVGLLFHNSPDFFALMWAAQSIGAVSVPINNRNRASELAYVVTDAQIRLVFTSTLGQEITDLPGRLTEGLDMLEPGRRPHVIVLEHGDRVGLPTSREVLAAAASADVTELEDRTSAVRPDDIALMIYTSGTTANPKGVPMLHRQLLSVGRQTGERWGARRGDTFWNALPCFHMSSTLPMLAALFAHGTWLSSPVFNAGEAIAMMSEFQVDLAWPAFGSIWQEILVHPEFEPSLISSLRAALAVAPPETIHVLEAAAPHVALLSCYGITEGIGVPVMVRWDDSREIRTGTGGLPFEGFEVEIRDPESGSIQPRGERGAIWIRGANLFLGYWNDPVRTSEVFDERGFFDTGDLGVMDEYGHVSYLGRIKDMLKVGGENVAAIEIEEHISTHPAVKLVAVVGAPDAKYGEVPAAYIELRPGASASEQDLIAHCQGRIASFKVPRYVRFVTEWPMSATKIRKIDLRDWITEELQQPT